MIKKNDEFKEQLENQYTILIKAEEREQKRRTLILYIICGLTLLMTIICLITVAISLGKTKQEIINNEEKTVYQTLTTNYNGNKYLDLQGIGNGYYLQEPKTIVISNEGTDTLTYNIKLTSVETSLTSTNNLTYTISKNNETSSQKDLPIKEDYLLKEIKLEAGETVTYKISVAFTGTLEYGNYSNYYKAQIVVEQNNKQMNLLN